ncbi:MAG: branched-chain amino acid ABC transporter permease [Burkholderiales bacterium]|nr:branched-chain amino acid ABC transporter permease [Burkholderiales bacterium]
MTKNSLILHCAILVSGIVAPLLFPGLVFQFAMLWIMILFALTWDVLGGQMGYNSLGNILFFGFGMYICAITQIGMFYDVGKYTAAFGAIKVDFTDQQYYLGLALGLVFAALASVVVAAVLSWVLFGLRGPYFAIGTLGAALAAAELTGSWNYVGGGGGISMPVFPGEPGARSLFFYSLCMLLTIVCYLFLRWLYQTRFGMALNAIRDDEDKAEAMGLHTNRYKMMAWSISAFFLGIVGGLFGNMTGFIEPMEVAYPTLTFGIFMVAMTLLGGKGTLWGPIIGAVLFHVLKEVTWTYLLGWQYVALGLLIIVNVVYFQQGIMGWMQEKWPERFGLVVDRAPGGAAPEDAQ